MGSYEIPTRRFPPNGVEWEIVPVAKRVIPAVQGERHALSAQVPAPDTCCRHAMDAFGRNAICERNDRRQLNDRSRFRSGGNMIFQNRADAGRRLAARLAEYAGRSDVVVLGLPRGGVPVAFEVAMRLGAPLDVLLVRKLGVPGHPELAMGAIAAGGVKVLHRALIRDLDIPTSLVEQVAVRERLELDRRDRLLRGVQQFPVVRDRTVIIIDDGFATGATMEAAILSVRAMKPASIIAAAPVGAKDTCDRLAEFADSVVCLDMPEPFSAVGLWYNEFAPTSDEEVQHLLREAGQRSKSVPVLQDRSS